MILPLIPGLLFIAIAAFVAAKLSPRFASHAARERHAARLSRSGGPHRRRAVAQKIQVVGLLFVKMLIDGVALLVTGVMKLVKAAEGSSAR